MERRIETLRKEGKGWDPAARAVRLLELVDDADAAAEKALAAGDFNDQSLDGVEEVLFRAERVYDCVFRLKVLMRRLDSVKGSALELSDGDPLPPDEKSMPPVHAALDAAYAVYNRVHDAMVDRSGRTGMTTTEVTDMDAAVNATEQRYAEAVRAAEAQARAIEEARLAKLAADEAERKCVLCLFWRLAFVSLRLLTYRFVCVCVCCACVVCCASVCLCVFLCVSLCVSVCV